LSEIALAALEGRNACLLANHGMIATGSDLEKAMWLAVEVETLCKQYAAALQIGTPHVLPDEEIARTVEKFREYGLRAIAPAAAQPAAPARPNSRRPRR
jgi:L-fuculose-phosphate aldolase